MGYRVWADEKLITGTATWGLLISVLLGGSRSRVCRDFSGLGFIMTGICGHL